MKEKKRSIEKIKYDKSQFCSKRNCNFLIAVGGLCYQHIQDESHRRLKRKTKRRIAGGIYHEYSMLECDWCTVWYSSSHERCPKCKSPNVRIGVMYKYNDPRLKGDDPRLKGNKE